MKQQDRYIAKEAFTFPLICFIYLAFNIYWGCADGWPVGAIICTSFSGIVVLCYIGKYLRFGRNYLKIDANGMEIKDWSKITSLKWSEIKKCKVYYKISYGSCLFDRNLVIFAKSKSKREQHIFVSLSGKYCRNKGVIAAIGRFGGNDVFDSQSSLSHNRYLIGIVMMIAVLAIILLVLISCNNCHNLTAERQEELFKEVFQSYKPVWKYDSIRANIDSINTIYPSAPDSLIYCRQYYEDGKLAAEGWMLHDWNREADYTDNIGIWKYYTRDGIMIEKLWTYKNIKR